MTVPVGVDQELIGEKDPSTKSYPTETLWEVDSSLYSLHPGKMAMSVIEKCPGSKSQWLLTKTTQTSQRRLP